MKKILIQIIVGYFCSFIGGVCFAFIYTGLSKLGIEIDYGGCKSQVFFSLFIGLPIGSFYEARSVNHKYLNFKFV